MWHTNWNQNVYLCFTKVYPQLRFTLYFLFQLSSVTHFVVQVLVLLSQYKKRKIGKMIAPTFAVMLSAEVKVSRRLAVETALLDVWRWKEEDKRAVLPLSQVRKHEKHQLTTALVASMWFLTWPLICSSIFASQDRVRRPITPESRSINSVKFVSYKPRLFFFAYIN